MTGTPERPGARPRAVLAFDPPELVEQIFGAEGLARLGRAVDIDPEVVSEAATPGARRRLAAAELLVAGWGAPPVPADLVPGLRAVAYAGGVARTCLADPAALAARGVTASNARAANAVPVAEYALAMILLANKRAHAAERAYRERRTAPDAERLLTGAGNYRRTVGIVGASLVGRRVVDLLRPFDLEVLLYSPELAPGPVPGLPGARAAGLDEVAARSDVLSLHQPLTPETAGQIDARVLALMPDGATLVNTARGGVVDGDALLAALRTGRIDAVLDVTDPEPPPPDGELWDLPNVVLTPHLAGSTGAELRRIGDSVVAEVERFARGLPFAHPEELVAA
ncbi:hydroxyacid dehydrogenase [Isoptericola sp. F-RaC21]|uniref:hydroxyacid dehydrogenase n=1 Tax=Isoptericola sp. F-RaC21 TaxID=3141452 RepID=UPI00315B97F8